MWIALAVLLIAVFTVMAVRLAGAVSRESTILLEFNQPTTLRLAVFLYPLGPLVLHLASWLVGFLLAAALAAACYIPGLVLARRLSARLERTGTDRVKAAQDTASEAFVTALGGLIYVFAYLLLWTGATFI